MSKHTKGPWHFKVAGNGDCGIKADGTGIFAEAFAEIRHSGENARDEALANARLIAAAPDLLEAAKAVYEWMNGLPIPTTGCTSKMQVLHDAIAKAEDTTHA